MNNHKKKILFAFVIFISIVFIVFLFNKKETYAPVDLDQEMISLQTN